MHLNTTAGGIPPADRRAVFAAPTPSFTKARIVFLDALRFVAAAAVLLQHSMEHQGRLGAKIVGILSPGVFGVVLFFIVSGFVIPMSVRGGFDVKEFAVRRIFRIYPLVIFTFILLFFCSSSDLFWNFTEIRTASLPDWVANILLVQDYVGARSLWGVTWTLSLEAAWYGIFALSLLSLGRRFDDWLSIAAPAGMITLGILSIFIAHRLPLARIGMVYAAILGCRIYRGYGGEVGVKRLNLDIGAFITVMIFCNVISFGYFKHPNITMNEAVFPWIAAPLFFLVFSNVTRVRQSTIVNSPIVRRLGAVSFSTYLLHPFALVIAGSLLPSGPSLIFGTLLSLVFSIAGYRFVEKPGQALGKRVISAVFGTSIRSGKSREPAAIQTQDD
jgi:peptidoglycan/LPS O-acetylase OafA/YrhL